MKKTLVTGAIIIGCTLVGAVGGAAVYDNYFDSKLVSPSTSTYGNTAIKEAAQVFQQPSMTKANFSSYSVPEDFVEAASRSINGVVNIRSEKTIQRSPRQFIDPFEFFFGFPGQRTPQGVPEGEAPKSVSIGSGVIISEDGYIITNNHVIEGATNIYATLNNNEEYEARIIGTDPATDIALIKIEKKGLQPIPFGDSEALKVGEWVLAIGNPFNLSSTVTAGIVSAKGRSALGSLAISSFIQTDAAVNPGNSGGALVNTRGELVGINTMIYSQTGNYAGYSFAVPVSIASKVVADIKQYGAVQRAVLGVMGGNINSEAKKEFDLKVSEGALVADFSDMSPAKKAGLEKGDVITNINGMNIRNMAQLQEQIGKYRPGDTVKVTIDRKGKKLTFDVKLLNAEGTTEKIEKVTASSIGVAFIEMPQNVKDKFGTKYGVEIGGISDKRFTQAGVQKGDYILSVNNINVSKVSEVEMIINKILSSNEDKVLFLKVLKRNGDIIFTAVDLR